MMKCDFIAAGAGTKSFKKRLQHQINLRLREVVSRALLP
jgi:hypothetical protein